jgi:hypothetical protein
MPDGATRLVSLHDPDARPISNGCMAGSGKAADLGPDDGDGTAGALAGTG